MRRIRNGTRNACGPTGYAGSTRQATGVRCSPTSGAGQDVRCCRTAGSWARASISGRWIPWRCWTRRGRPWISCRLRSGLESRDAGVVGGLATPLHRPHHTPRRRCRPRGDRARGDASWRRHRTLDGPASPRLDTPQHRTATMPGPGGHETGCTAPESIDANQREGRGSEGLRRLHTGHSSPHAVHPTRGKDRRRKTARRRTPRRHDREAGRPPQQPENPTQPPHRGTTRSPRRTRHRVGVSRAGQYIQLEGKAAVSRGHTEEITRTHITGLRGLATSQTKGGNWSSCSVDCSQIVIGQSISATRPVAGQYCSRACVACLRRSALSAREKVPAIKEN